MLAGAEPLLHWSATLVALLTLNCLVAPAVAELELIPVLALAELLPGAEPEAPAGPGLVFAAPSLVLPVAAPSCPVI